MYYKANGNMLVTCNECGKVKVDDVNTKFFPIYKEAGKRIWLCERCRNKKEFLERCRKSGNSSITMIFTPSVNDRGEVDVQYKIDDTKEN